MVKELARIDNGAVSALWEPVLQAGARVLPGIPGRTREAGRREQDGEVGRNRLLKGVVGAAVMAFGLTAMPSAASAAAGDRIKIIEFNLCLDVKEFSTKDGARVQLWSCNGNANQRWRMYKDGTIRSALNGKCLDVREFNAKNGAIVQMWSCSGASNQQWYWSNSKYTRAGYRMLRSRLNNFCLDATGKQHKLGTPLQMWSCSSAWNQAFRWI